MKIRYKLNGTTVKPPKAMCFLTETEKHHINDEILSSAHQQTQDILKHLKTKRMIVNATELRIGNYGKLWNFWGKRWSKEMQINGKDISILEKDPTSFEPIVITKEWLLKFGFKEYNSQYYRDDFEYRLTPHFDTVNVAMFKTKDDWNNTLIAKIKYVHELQNLYFSLCKKELTS
jgi:hypothetical protein